MPLPVEALFQLRGKSDEYSLQPIQQLLSLLGNPHQKLEQTSRVIHAAGTNGKGSTLVTLEALLLRSGFSVGMTISPHLLQLNERYRINGQPVSDEDLEWAYLLVCNALEIQDPEDPLPSLQKQEFQPSFFEISIAMAFLLFEKHQVEYVLLETGLGGRLDATNVIQQPVATLLTSVGLDHQDFLGESVEEIVQEKLGILKPNSPLFVAKQKPEMLTLIEEACQKMGVPCFSNPKDYTLTEGRFSFSAATVAIPEIGLQGDYQKENIATALACYLWIMDLEQLLSEQAIQETIAHLSWPARMEWVASSLLPAGPPVLLEGAHNADGLTALAEYLQKHYSDQKVCVAMGMMEGKELPEILQGLKDFVTFQPLDYKMVGAMSGKSLAAKLQGLGLTVNHSLPLQSLTEKLPQNFDLIVVTGSIYLLGEFKALLAAE